MQNAFCIHYAKDNCFFPTEDQRQKRIPWLTHLYSLPPNSAEILQAILEAKTMERLTKNKLTRTSERRKRLKKFQFSSVACTREENDTLLGTDRKYLEETDQLLCPSKRHLGMAFFSFHYLHGWSHLLGDITTLGTVSEV